MQKFIIALILPVMLASSMILADGYVNTFTITEKKMVTETVTETKIVDGKTVETTVEKTVEKDVTRNATSVEVFDKNLNKFLTDNNLSGWVNDNKQAFQSIVDANKSRTDIDSGFQSGTYFQSSVQPAWNQILGIFNDTDNQKEYAKRSTDLVRGYVEDMVSKNQDGTPRVAANSDYAADMSWLVQSANEHKTAANTSAFAGQVRSFDPKAFLDSGAPNLSNDFQIKVNITFGGVGKMHAQNIKALINRIKHKFGSGGQDDLQYFSDSLPSSNELAVMDAQSAVGFNVTGNEKMATVNAGFHLSDYGTISSGGNMPPISETYTMVDETRNNRQYGYYDGNYNTVSIQVGSRQYQLYDHLYTSPLVLDMDGDGKLEASKGEYLPHKYDNAKVAEFDMDGDDFVDVVEWVGSNDGLLVVMPKNGDVTAQNLFGEAGGFIDGFEKLSVLDTNKDGQISEKELSTLSVWQDKNGNAKVDEGEVASVVSLGITSISVRHTNMVASFVQNGVTKTLWDWYPAVFRVKRTK